ncbi:Holliday junction branch migration protein RuvA [Chlamydia trachomatis]|uniref:Holliday junction branch migration complex subunit RuvA n=1 Tax=Chlamydia trachomatis serovar D (strain ATCC VR-885 / DSM 19411 / UW-3/Cx) TaxID=272561 RepID=RUVA_CHLTR|nr:Holliday junction branch migration protein RuvA [Chlamydia trachomatis]NP_220016.1 Holliday junction DNA helicase RuvA [Chlamydia trachomatis D/UW-3/CX]O84509.1 RecName: Full=Holliday junction branch migration complex subunit RuvA [Chlamydia trachomatis D/UW-3/CX]AAC68102.1 Holliday Junction Helicase [Chlamydia trachomatis D/UW-3/CX]ADH19132.1 Holliday junction DNA helicase RuvA [Chlamydia trachomatis G/11222]ADI51177.1 RuvA [Chlamydia trachomatis D-EC]ADI52189.1 RuvA [Chlamydia trachomati
MYEYIKGTLTHINESYVVIESFGIGYAIMLSERFLVDLRAFMHQEVLIYVHSVIRETEHVLYGFSSRAERECFRLLISFSGIGPKTGLSILNMFPLQELCSIARLENVKAIASVPGIGKKTAEKLMVDLKQKLPTLMPLYLEEPVVPSSTANSSFKEGIGALMNLGFSRLAADRMMTEAVKELSEEASVAELLPIALRKS